MSYIVWNPARGFLRLWGPFAYPVWEPTLQGATAMTFTRAHAFANAYGGEVRGMS